MTRPAQPPRKALLACSALIAPALFLAGCSSREDEIAERNAQLAEQARAIEAKRHATKVSERKKAAPSPKKLGRQEKLADFYGAGDGDEDEDANGEKGKKQEEPDFLDPTSDYYDNTYVVPEPVSVAGADVDTGSVDTTSADSSGEEPEA